MDSALPYLVGLIIVALAFDFLNGLHDAANSIATIVSTRVLPPQYAVFWAAFFNFVAFLFFGLNVAHTIGTGIIAPDVIDDHVVFGALMGAIIWNVLTWALGIPSSSSHALIGGLVGSGTAKAGLAVIVWSGLMKTSAAVVLSPALGFVLALFSDTCGFMDFCPKNASRGRQAVSLAAVHLRRRSIRWATAAMTRRRRWASSLSCSFRTAAWGANFASRFGLC